MENLKRIQKSSRKKRKNINIFWLKFINMLVQSQWNHKIYILEYMERNI